jgi:hypothetical protein
LINGLASALFDRTELHFSRSRPLSFTGAMASANDAAWTPHTKLLINFSRALLPTGPRYSDSLPRTDSHVSRPGEASGGASYHEKQLAGCGMRLGTGNGGIQKTRNSSVQPRRRVPSPSRPIACRTPATMNSASLQPTLLARRAT